MIEISCEFVSPRTVKKHSANNKGKKRKFLPFTIGFWVQLPPMTAATRERKLHVVTWLSSRSGRRALISMSCMLDRAEQRLRMCRDGKGLGNLGSKLVSFAEGFLKHPYILAIFKVDSEYLRFPFKVKVDYFILYSILVSTFVIFLLLFSMNKRRRTRDASLL